MEPIKKSDIDKVFGKIFKEYRLKNRITQEDLSETLGISPKYISRIENGNSGIKTQTLISYINLLGISPNVLYKDFIKNEDLKRKTLIFEKISNLSEDKLELLDSIIDLLENFN